MATKNQAVPLKPKPKSQRPRCLDCTKPLEPQIIGAAALPARLMDGRRKAEREDWEKANPPRFTGHYGRFGDDRFCGISCGYQYALRKTKAKRR
jgi:hypothetical protein